MPEPAPLDGIVYIRPARNQAGYQVDFACMNGPYGVYIGHFVKSGRVFDSVEQAERKTLRTLWQRRRGWVYIGVVRDRFCGQTHLKVLRGIDHA